MIACAFLPCSGMQTAKAELLYIKEVEKLDGFGQESFPAKVVSFYPHKSFRFKEKPLFLSISSSFYRTTTPTTFLLECLLLECLSNTEMAGPSCSTSRFPFIFAVDS